MSVIFNVLLLHCTCKSFYYNKGDKNNYQLGQNLTELGHPKCLFQLSQRSKCVGQGSLMSLLPIEYHQLIRRKGHSGNFEIIRSNNYVICIY